MLKPCFQHTNRSEHVHANGTVHTGVANCSSVQLMCYEQASSVLDRISACDRQVYKWADGHKCQIPLHGPDRTGPNQTKSADFVGDPRRPSGLRKSPLGTRLKMLRLRPRATFSTSRSSYLTVALTTMHHLYNVSNVSSPGFNKTVTGGFQILR